jgi:hypothetical protein
MSHASVIVALPNGLSLRNGQMELAVAEQMAPFDENGDWFADGSRWDWWQIGGRFSGSIAGRNCALRGDVTPEAARQHRLERAALVWDEAERERKNDPVIRELIYGIRRDETREQFLDRTAAKGLSAFAFLSGHRWHESGRLGWFGWHAATECELRGAAQPTICKFKHPAGSAEILSYGGVDEDRWYSTYHARFIESLPEDTMLVVVDYHV